MTITNPKPGLQPSGALQAMRAWIPRRWGVQSYLRNTEVPKLPLTTGMTGCQSSPQVLWLQWLLLEGCLPGGAGCALPQEVAEVIAVLGQRIQLGALLGGWEVRLRRGSNSVQTSGQEVGGK